MMEGRNVSRTQRPTPYEKWMQEQRIPVIEGYGVTDLQQQPAAHWQSLGCSAAFVHLKGMEGITGMYAAEIPVGGETKTEKHLYEEVVYVLKGKGKTQLFGPGEGANSFDWEQGSLFAVPLNAPRKLINTGTEPAVFLAVTTAPWFLISFTMRNLSGAVSLSLRTGMRASPTISPRMPQWKKGFGR